MHYLCLGYYAPEAYDAMTDEERKALGERCRPHDEAFNGTGKVRDVASLQHRAGAHIRPGPDGPSVTDGPFAEAKEVVGSYFLIEADSLEQATEIASLHPAARIGWEIGFSMEVRPVETVWVKDGEYVGPARGRGGWVELPPHQGQDLLEVTTLRYLSMSARISCTLRFNSGTL